MLLTLLLLIPIIGIFVILYCFKRFIAFAVKTPIATVIRKILTFFDINVTIIVFISVVLRAITTSLGDLHFIKYPVILFVVFSTISFIKVYKEDNLPSMKEIFIILLRVLTCVYLFNETKSDLLWLFEYVTLFAVVIAGNPIDEFMQINLFSTSIPVESLLDNGVFEFAGWEWRRMCDRLLQGAENYVNDVAARSNITNLRIGVELNQAFNASTSPFTIHEKRGIERYLSQVGGYANPSRAIVYSKRANGDIVSSVITNMRNHAA